MHLSKRKRQATTLQGFYTQLFSKQSPKPLRFASVNLSAIFGDPFYCYFFSLVVPYPDWLGTALTKKAPTPRRSSNGPSSFVVLLIYFYQFAKDRISSNPSIDTASVVTNLVSLCGPRHDYLSKFQQKNPGSLFPFGVATGVLIRFVLFSADAASPVVAK